MRSEWLERTELLLGADGIERLSSKRVAVIGLGGVGAYAAEMIARAGVGSMVILDSDCVSQSNRNRQLLALSSTVGLRKSEQMALRLMDINPDIRLKVLSDYLTLENIDTLLGGEELDFLVDAIDTLAPKTALITWCIERGIPLVSSMGAGAKVDATKIRVTDISKSYNCPLAAVLRKRLRANGISKGFKVVFSEELPNKEAVTPMTGELNKRSMLGTISYLPAVFGCVCAQVAIEYLNIN